MACTLACDEGRITAHKNVLCEHSKYLQDILSKYPDAEHPIIILTEPSIKEIKILVNYMYTGELVLTDDTTTTSLLRAAQILKINALTAEDDDDVDDVDDVDEDIDNIDHNRNDNHSILQQQPNLPHNLQQQQQRHLHLNQNQHQQVANNNNSNNNSINRFHHQHNNNHNNHHQQQNHHRNSNNHHNHHNNSHDHDPADHDDDDEEDDRDDLIDDDERDEDDEFNLSLEKGEQLISDNNKNKIRCHLCNIGLSDVKCLYRHVLTRHLPEKWGYKCEFCDREFSRDDHLMRHYTTKHKNMEFDREKIRETRRLNREMAKNFHDQIQYQM